MEKALDLYEELKDMDFIDYVDSQETDVKYIAALIDEIGVKAARDLLID